MSLILVGLWLATPAFAEEFAQRCESAVIAEIQRARYNQFPLNQTLRGAARWEEGEPGWYRPIDHDDRFLAERRFENLQNWFQEFKVTRRPRPRREAAGIALVHVDGQIRMITFWGVVTRVRATTFDVRIFSDGSTLTLPLADTNLLQK